MIAIIKYNAGNTTSVVNAVQRLGYPCIVTDDREQILNADKVIFPGVGSAASAMSYLKDKELDKVILSITKPFLGICLGLQLMCKNSAEGDVTCLGIFDTNVKLFPPEELVPHMGWNEHTEVNSPLFDGIENTEDFYFVHSYYAEVSEDSVAVCDYILPFSSAMKKDNYYAVQFHPEKSADIGNQLLQNFLKLES